LNKDKFKVEFHPMIHLLYFKGIRYSFYALDNDLTPEKEIERYLYKLFKVD